MQQGGAFSQHNNTIQCGRSILSQNGGADLSAYCSVKFPMTLKMGLERSQLFPEIFEIVLRPFWWAAGSEQPSPPLHRAAAARLLRCFDKYKSLYTRNLLAIIFLVYTVYILSVIGNFTLQWARRSAPHLWEGQDRPHCI